MALVNYIQHEKFKFFGLIAKKKVSMTKSKVSRRGPVSHVGNYFAKPFSFTYSCMVVATECEKIIPNDLPHVV